MGDLYFCVLISYIRYPLNSQCKETENVNDENYRKRLYESDESEDKEQENEEEEKKEYEISQNEDVMNENDRNYKIDSLEISIFDAPSAFCPTNQIQKKSKNKTKTVAVDITIFQMNIENALDPRLCYQFLCDFKLQRLVEYYDIFGISSSNADANNNNDCKICLSFPANVILLPCRHCCCCYECYKQIESCPMCRK